MKILPLIFLSLFTINAFSQAPLKQLRNPVSKLDSIEKANDLKVKNSGDDITKANISLTDSSFNLHANIRKDHRFFGYSQPNVKSNKLILFSIFTDDVENNPFNCTNGAYYDSTNLNIKHIATTGNFIKVSLKRKEEKGAIMYFEKKWIGFDR